MSSPSIDLTGVQFSRLSDYFGLWSIEPTRGLAFYDRVSNTDLVSHVLATQAIKEGAERDKGRTKIESRTIAANGGARGSNGQEPSRIALIELSGTMMKHSSSLDESSSTVDVRRAITLAANDPNIGGILLVIDSPGGSVAGTADLAAAVRSASAKKPVHAIAEDLAASAAYWVGSQADRFVANDHTALIGSIGTFIGTYDRSEEAGKFGVKAKLYATGPLKGTGFPGAEITAEQDAYLQGIVDQTQEHFASAVAQGRNMSAEAVKKASSGGVFIAGNALKLGLIDGIESMESAIANLSDAILSRSKSTTAAVAASPKGAKQMAAANEETKPEDVKPADNTGDKNGEGDKSKPDEPVKPAESRAVEGQRFVDAFGEQGASYYALGLSFEAAKDRFIVGLKGQITTLSAKVEEQKTIIAGLRGEAAPLSTNPAVEGGSNGDASKYSGVLSDGFARAAAGIKLPKSGRN